MLTWLTAAEARRHACSALCVGAWLAALLICSAFSAAAQCTGPGAPTTTQTKCLTAIAIPGNPIRSFDISWVNPNRAEYYLADRSNKGIDVIDTRHNTFKKTIGGFVGLNSTRPKPPWITIIPDRTVSLRTVSGSMLGTATARSR